MRSVTLAAMALLSLLIAGPVLAQEHEERAERERHIRHLIRQEQEGDILGGEERRHLEEYYRRRIIIRPRLDIRQSSHYAIAEIYLKKREFEKATKALQEVIADARDAKTEVVWTTHYNLARIHRRQLRHVQKALAEYRKVKGRWKDRATAEAVAMLRDAGDWERGARFIEGLYAGAKEKGEKLALLVRLAQLYRHTDQEEKAIETYQRITKEVTPEDIKQMKQAAADFVQKTAARIHRYREQDVWHEAEKLHRKLAQRERTLREQERHDEHHAFMRAMHEFRRKMEEWERRHRERERKHDHERGADRDRDPEREEKRDREREAEEGRERRGGRE